MHVKGINENEARKVDEVLIDEYGLDTVDVFIPRHDMILLYLVAIEPSRRLADIQSHQQQAHSPVRHMMYQHTQTHDYDEGMELERVEKVIECGSDVIEEDDEGDLHPQVERVERPVQDELVQPQRMTAGLAVNARWP